MTDTYVKGIAKGTQLTKLTEILKPFISKTLNDLNWLKVGETVLIKVPVNSTDPYPATGHPAAVAVLIHLIKQKGGIPIVGDQSGIEYVVHGPKGIVKGSTHDCFEQAGVKIKGAKYVAFEEDGWDSFVLVKHSKANNWPKGFYVTSWIDKADHIIALPRISTHAQGGVTLGAKNWVGCLREDSRMIFHAQGPFNFAIKDAAKGSGLQANKQPGLDFFKMIAELQLAIRAKLRGTIFVATKVQTTMGPNKFLFNKFGIKLLKAYEAEPDVGILIGSQDPVAADAVALAFLFDCYEQTPWFRKVLQKLVTLFNGQILELGSYSVWDNPFIAHGLRLGLGSRFDDANKLIIDDASGVSERLIKLTK
jgi:uncharacterized protein (DUF362 family)